MPKHDPRLLKPVPEGMQICTTCVPHKALQPLDNFYNVAKGKGGKSNRCKKCLMAAKASYNFQIQHARATRREHEARQAEQRMLRPYVHKGVSSLSPERMQIPSIFAGFE